MTIMDEERSDWEVLMMAQYLDADRVCRGNLLSRKGQAAGVSELSLWSGPENVALAYASEELRNYWLKHPRLTLTEYRRGLGKNRREERATQGTGVRCYADIPAKEVNWAMRNFLAYGFVSLLIGDAKIGKGLWWADIAARFTRGDDMPDGTPGGSAGSVLLVTPEDDPEYTLAHRLPAAGAVMEHIFDLTEPYDDSDEWFTLQHSIPMLRREIARIKANPELPDVRLVVLDPFMGITEVTPSNNVTVRKMLRPLHKLARQENICVILVNHTVKSGAVAGSKGLTDLHRISLLIEEDADNPDVRVASVKMSNLGPKDVPPLRYVIGGDAPRSRVIYMRPMAAPQARPQGPGQQAVYDVLSDEDGPLSVQDIATESGFAVPTVRVLLSRMKTAGLVANGSERGTWTVNKGSSARSAA